MISASDLQNEENISPLHTPINLHQMHQDQSEKIYYRNSPERFDYSGLHQQKINPARFMQVNEQLGEFRQFMHPGHFSNSGQFGEFMDPTHFRNPSQFGQFMNPSHFSNPTQFMNPSHFSRPNNLEQLNYQSMFRRFRSPNNPQQRSYSKREGMLI